MVPKPVFTHCSLSKDLSKVTGCFCHVRCSLHRVGAQTLAENPCRSTWKTPTSSCGGQAAFPSGLGEAPSCWASSYSWPSALEGEWGHSEQGLLAPSLGQQSRDTSLKFGGPACDCSSPVFILKLYFERFNVR